MDLQIPMEMNIFALQLDLNLDIQFQNTTLISNRDNSTGREGPSIIKIQGKIERLLQSQLSNICLQFVPSGCPRDI